MKAEEIIYRKLRSVWANGTNLTVMELERLARDTVEEIREEFKKAGVDVWDVWKGGET